MRRTHLISGAMLALLARAEPKAKYAGPMPKRMTLKGTPDEVKIAFEVWFNGERQNACIDADTESGVITRYVRKRNGEYLRNKESGEVVTETLEGKVEFRRV